MLRRLLPTLVALVLGLAGLGWGLWRLQRIFVAEREEARAALSSRREVLEQYALASLGQTLRERLEEARPALELAAADPLAPAPGFYLRERGAQLLPRLSLHEPGTDTPARERYTRLRAGTEDSGAEEGPWRERLALLHALERALTERRGREASAALASFLAHRGQYVLASTRDIPSCLVVLELLIERGQVESWLLPALLREGVRVGEGERLDGLQRWLLLKRARFTRADFDFLRERVVALSVRTGTPVMDFEARTAELAPEPLALPASLPGPVLVGAGWYLEPHGEGEARGVAVDLPALWAGLAREMHERGLLDTEGRVRPRGEDEVLALATLRLDVETPEWAREERVLEQRYRLKTGMVVLCAGLALTIVALAFLGQRRKARFLELKSDFVATVSHELRTPLASIRLLAETLEWRLAQGTDSRDYPARILREADGLGFLVENLLSFHRVDKGRWVPHLSRVRLDEELATLRRDLEGWSRVPVELVAEVGERELLADPQLLRLLFANLARNACAYNTRSPVCLRVEALEGGRVRFSDNGVGIPEAEWRRVFGEFYRLRGQGREVAGSGLGLALCERIMRLHHGSLRVARSSAEGTTFELTFPEPRE